MSGAITATTVAVAALSTAEIFTAVAITGAVIGAVGTVTGIKPLQYAGMALGAIGGIGALAVSAGIIGGDALGTATTAGSLTSDAGIAGSFDAASNAVGAAGAVDATTGEALAGAVPLQGFAASPSAGGPTDIVDTVSGQVTTPDANLTSSLVNSQGPSVTPAAATDTGIPDGTGALNAGDVPGKAAANGLDNPTGPGLIDTPSAPTVQTPGVPATPQATSANILAGGQGVTGVPGAGPTVTGFPTSATDPLAGIGNSSANTAVAIQNAKTGATTFTPGGTSVFGDLMKTVGTPGAVLGAGAIQAAGSFIAGATSSLTPAQVNALNAQAAANQAAANLSTLQQSNIRSGIPVASRPGLVNSPNVTGAPA